jgi:hypothetical protein
MFDSLPRKISPLLACSHRRLRHLLVLVSTRRQRSSRLRRAEITTTETKSIVAVDGDTASSGRVGDETQ